MTLPIVATKLFIPPPRATMVHRPRLIARLNAGLAAGHPLTLISAAAGCGKTTLLADWLSERMKDEGRGMKTGQPGSSSFILHPSSFAWLSLDAADSDPTRFLTYLVAALQTPALPLGKLGSRAVEGVAPTIGVGVMGLLQSAQPPPVEAILTALLNELAALPDRIILVLDDYHALDSPAVDQALAFLIEHLPPQLHLVIATREDPHLPLARMRARDQLTELRAAELRFTPAEAAEFLTQVMGLNLSAEDIGALETRTEGWIAGLQLAALSMQGHHDAASFIASFTGSHRFVLDYLLEEVLERQPVEVQTFLLRTSILDRMCGPLCDAVVKDEGRRMKDEDRATGSDHAEPFILHPSSFILAQLERANLFIVPLDNERRWYRYHHLFGELLRQRLGRPVELPAYHLRASAWYEANDDLAAAFHHALAAGDAERAARLAEVAWPGMEQRFQTAAWLGWMQQLPPAVVRSRPRLCFQLGSAFFDAGEPEASEAHLQNAERALAGAMDQAEAASLPGNIALIRAANAQLQGNLAETVKYAELALQLAPADDAYLRAQAGITLELTHWASGDLEAALNAMRAWMDDMQRLGNPVFVIASAFAVADMYVIMGHLGDAEQILRQAIQRAAAQGYAAESVTAHHHLGLALLAHERGDAAATAQHMHTAADLGRRTTLVDWTHRWNLAQARLKESAQEWDAALALLDEARRDYVKTAVPILQPVEARKARVYLKQGRLDKAQAWVREQGISTQDAIRYLDEYDQLTLARVRLAEGVFAGVDDVLERLLALAETQQRTGSIIEILVTQALVQQAQRNQPAALAALKRALTLAEPEGYLRMFVDEGAPMAALLERMKAEGGRMKTYLHTLLAGFGRQDDVQPSAVRLTLTAEALSPQPLVEPLSERELEVLRLIAEGQSNRAISRRLYLALSTVKGHNLRIFNKLQVQNRTEAVARARELGLL